jgi:hypothetical protein
MAVRSPVYGHTRDCLRAPATLTLGPKSKRNHYIQDCFVASAPRKDGFSISPQPLAKLRLIMSISGHA